MNKSPSLLQYSAGTRALHWLSVIAIAVAHIAMEIREDMPRSNAWRPAAARPNR